MFGLSGRQIFLLLVFLAILFASAQYLPPYYAAFQFNDFIRQEVKYAVTARRSIPKVRDRVIEKAGELGIEIDPTDVQITRRGPSFTLDLEYRFPIDLKVYKHELVFNVSENGEVWEDARDRTRP